MAPLPRANLLAIGDAYLNPAAPDAQGSPMRLAFSDDLKGPRAPLVCADAAQQPDFEAALAVFTGDVPQAATPAQALDSVRLLALAVHTRLRALDAQPAQAPMATPGTAFSPVAVTPDELVWSGESAWVKGRLNLTLQCSVNGRKFGLCETGSDMRTHFGQLIAQLCQTRRLRAGAIVSSGEVRNLEASRGCSSVATRRALEVMQDGKQKTPWLSQGDSVLVDMKGRAGMSVFGAIDQDVQIGAQAALPAK
jgi:fumarylacetoacetate (FAA) hydrolase